MAMVTLHKSSTSSLNFEIMPSASLHRVPYNLFHQPHISLLFLHDSCSNNVAKAQMLITVVRQTTDVSGYGFK